VILNLKTIEYVKQKLIKIGNETCEFIADNTPAYSVLAGDADIPYQVLKMVRFSDGEFEIHIPEK